MNRDEIDRALVRLRDERESISDGLLELEDQQGYQLLKGTRLTGATQKSWDEIQARTATLWGLFDAYTRTLGAAEDLRARKARPDHDELAELTRLLTGRSIELAAEIPLERRTLLGPSAERLSLSEVVVRMNGLYEQAAKTISSLDATLSELLGRLSAVDDEHRAGQDLLARLNGHDPEFDRLTGQLTEIRETVRTDPLTADVARLDRVGAALAALRPRLLDAVQLSEEHETRTRRITESIGLIETARDEAGAAREQVLAKIANPVLPDIPDLAPALTDRLAGLDALRGRWTELAARLAETEAAVTAALTQTRDAAAIITGLLDRREELRGRLLAYRAKAARLGKVEDTESDRLYRQAHDLLWTSPCDLRQATVALADYQRAIGGADR